MFGLVEPTRLKPGLVWASVLSPEELAAADRRAEPRRSAVADNRPLALERKLVVP